MNEQEMVRDLIDAISQGNALEAEDIFDTVMASKSIEALDDMRVEVAKGMFNQED